MRKFVNVIIVLIALVIIAALGLPLAMGFWLNSHYSKVLNQINIHQQTTIKLVKFDRGWFVSKATVQVILHQISGSSPSSPLTLTIQQRIKNGPFLVGKVDGYSSGLLFAKGLVYSNSDHPDFVFHATTLLHFNDTIDTTFNIKHMSFTKNQQQYVFDDVISNMTYLPKTKELMTHVTIANASISKNQQVKLMFEKFSIQSQQRKVASLWVGHQNARIDKIILPLANNQQLEINQCTSDFSQTEKEDTTTLLITLHADNIISQGLLLKPVDLNLIIGDLNTKLLTQLMKRVNHLPRHTALLTQQNLQTLYMPIVTLLSKGFNVNLNNFTIGTTEGDIKITGNILLPQTTASASTGFTVNNLSAKLQITAPLTWLNQFVAELYEDNTLTLPNTTTSPNEAAQQLVQQWLNNKVILPNGKNVTTEFILNDGQILVNSYPFQAEKIRPPEPSHSTTPNQNDPTVPPTTAPTVLPP